MSTTGWTKEAAHAAINNGAVLPGCCLRRTSNTVLSIVSIVASIAYGATMLGYAANSTGSGLKFVAAWSMLTSLSLYVLILAISDEELSDSIEGCIVGIHFTELLKLFVVHCIFYDYAMIHGTAYSLKVAFVLGFVAFFLHLVTMYKHAYLSWHIHSAVVAMTKAKSPNHVNITSASISDNDHFERCCDNALMICCSIPAALFVIAAIAGGVFEIVQLSDLNTGEKSLTGMLAATITVTAIILIMFVFSFLQLCGCFGILHTFWYSVLPVMYFFLFNAGLMLVAARAEFGYSITAHLVFVVLYSVGIAGHVCMGCFCVDMCEIAATDSGYTVGWDDPSIIAATSPDSDIAIDDVLKMLDGKPPGGAHNLPSLIRAPSSSNMLERIKKAEEEKKAAEEMARAAKMRAYTEMVSLAMDDDVLSIKEEATLLRYRKEHGITEEEHAEVMKTLGYTTVNVTEAKEMAKPTNDALMRNYRQMLALAMADGVISPSEAKLLEQERNAHGISEQLHDTILEALGYTKKDYEAQLNAGLNNQLDAISPPPYWRMDEHKEADNKASFHVLQPTSDEYKAVAAAFNATCGSTHDILSISYIMNPYLWRAYNFVLSNIARNISCFKQQPFSLVNANERRLWHGTHPNYISTIATRGFRREFTTTMAFGKGVYFARDSAYSSSVSYAKVDVDGTQQMFYCRVVAGESAQGSSNADSPQKVGQPGVHYETMVDNCANPGIYVATADFQAYPEFVVKFKTKTKVT